MGSDDFISRLYAVMDRSDDWTPDELRISLGEDAVVLGNFFFFSVYFLQSVSC